MSMKIQNHGYVEDEAVKKYLDRVSYKTRREARYSLMGFFN